MINNFKYVIVGAGLAGCSAIRGIREIDKHGSILLIGNERYLPYNRPPLSKSLIIGKKQIADIFVENESYFIDQCVNIELNTKVIQIDSIKKIVYTETDHKYFYDKLLIATGANPRKLINSNSKVIYYRYLDDYRYIKDTMSKSDSVVILGGGLIGSELASSLAQIGKNVTLIFPEETICSRMFPKEFGLFLNDLYKQKGVKIISNESVSKIDYTNNFILKTEKKNTINCDHIIVGIGVNPELELAFTANIAVSDGIIVNEYLETSNKNIYAAGDNALFPYAALKKVKRVEHWDNSLNQGVFAGKNMAGGRVKYVYIPYFFSDIFEHGYEAVGEISSSLMCSAVWSETYLKGIIYYSENDLIKGIFLWNVWDKLEQAREVLRNNTVLLKNDLKKIIEF